MPAAAFAVIGLKGLGGGLRTDLLNIRYLSLEIGSCPPLAAAKALVRFRHDLPVGNALQNQLFRLESVTLISGRPSL